MQHGCVADNRCPLLQHIEEDPRHIAWTKNDANFREVDQVRAKLKADRAKYRKSLGMAGASPGVMHWFSDMCCCC
jgi:hypothetical protein